MIRSETGDLYFPQYNPERRVSISSDRSCQRLICKLKPSASSVHHYYYHHLGSRHDGMAEESIFLLGRVMPDILFAVLFAGVALMYVTSYIYIYI